METIFYLTYSLILVIFTVFVLLSSRPPRTRLVWRMADELHGYAVEVYECGVTYAVGFTTDGRQRVMNYQVFTSHSHALSYAQEQYDLHSAVYAAWGKNIGR